MSTKGPPDRASRVIAGLGMGTLVGTALAGPVGAVLGALVGALIGWPFNGPRGKSPLHPPFPGGFVNDVGCDRWMLLAATNEAGNVIYVETVKLAAGVTFDSGAERVTFHVIAVGGATEIHERYAKMELIRG